MTGSRRPIIAALIVAIGGALAAIAVALIFGPPGDLVRSWAFLLLVAGGISLVACVALYLAFDRRASITAGSAVAVSAGIVLISALLPDVIAFVYGKPTASWPTASDRAVIADSFRLLVGVLSALTIAVVVSRRVWPEYLLGLVGVLAAIAVAGAVIATVSGRYADPPPAVSPPLTTVPLPDAEFLTPECPEVGSTAQVVVVVQKRNADNDVVETEAEVFAALVTATPSPGAETAPASPGTVPPAPDSAECLRSYSVSRGENNSNVAEVLRLLASPGRQVYVVAAEAGGG